MSGTERRRLAKTGRSNACTKQRNLGVGTLASAIPATGGNRISDAETKIEPGVAARHTVNEA
jgi:hypothetical protein